MLIVSRAREGKTDGHGFGIKPLLHRGESLHQSGQATLSIGGHSLQADGFHHLFIVADGREHKVGASCIQRQYNLLVVGHSCF